MHSAESADGPAACAPGPVQHGPFNTASLRTPGLGCVFGHAQPFGSRPHHVAGNIFKPGHDLDLMAGNVLLRPAEVKEIAVSEHSRSRDRGHPAGEVVPVTDKCSLRCPVRGPGDLIHLNVECTLTKYTPSGPRVEECPKPQTLRVAVTGAIQVEPRPLAIQGYDAADDVFRPGVAYPLVPGTAGRPSTSSDQKQDDSCASQTGGVTYPWIHGLRHAVARIIQWRTFSSRWDDIVVSPPTEAGFLSSGSGGRGFPRRTGVQEGSLARANENLARASFPHWESS